MSCPLATADEDPEQVAGPGGVCINSIANSQSLSPILDHCRSGKGQTSAFSLIEGVNLSHLQYVDFQ
ncbi:hypothetical protein SAMN05421753_12055 [Planctomicrobium piriforme]|uniref:Uncharacterized protein n=1 Tax=Planctomicrobium piriforme TaxID=1576369 RepID=A0A1I3R9W7_9PLAN|nr:hypothetical protein SAMN05421753_12055 [Planctomicrobium piriforme]